VRHRFVVFMGLRYFSARRHSTGATSTVLSVLGVAVGVMTLTAVLGVMNGFQLGFIESILEVSSYHLQVQPAGDESISPDVLPKIRSLPSVSAAVPFAEYQVIIEGRFDEQRGCLVRGLPADVELLDPGFEHHLEIVSGAFDLARPGAIVLGVELARHLGVSVGDTVTLLSLEGASFADLNAFQHSYRVAGLFRSGYYEFDLGWAFFSLAEAAALDPQAAPRLSVGVKIRNRFRDQLAAEHIRQALGRGAYRVVSWREFNRAFFGALRMEKIMMMVLIGLIFIVVGFNVYHSQRRAVRERFEEIGVLKALGASEAAIRRVFVLDGLLIGLLGSLFGLLLGLFLSANINTVFTVVEALANGFLGILERLLFPLLRYSTDRFSLFSPAYFYITEVPSRVLPQEAVLIVLFALFSPALAALSAASRVKQVKPAEVLRYE
jgi:lipoprotein-releasing system permease protein